MLLCVDFIHPHDREQAAHVIKKGFNKGEYFIELRLNHKDGSWLWFESGGKTFIDEHGNKKVLIISRDITERKLAENKLRNSENKYRHLFTSSPLAIILIDSKGIVVDCNPAVKQLLGYKKEGVYMVKSL